MFSFHTRDMNRISCSSLSIYWNDRTWRTWKTLISNRCFFIVTFPSEKRRNDSPSLVSLQMFLFIGLQSVVTKFWSIDRSRIIFVSLIHSRSSLIGAVELFFFVFDYLINWRDWLTVRPSALQDESIELIGSSAVTVERRRKGKNINMKKRGFFFF